MTITSLSFAGFVLITLALYYALPRRPQNILLLAASYVFYLTWSPTYTLILAALTAINFALSHRVRRADQPRRRWMWAGIGINVAALAFFKFADFFKADFSDLVERLGFSTGAGGLEILLPVGMSFYIVAVISYLIDAARGQVEPTRDPVDFALYMAYFPKLIAGPIERARVFLPRLAEPRIVDNDRLSRSFTLIVVGVVRKLVIADLLTTLIPENVFQTPAEFSPLELAGYLVAYAFALYNDFAGYTSIARGVSGLFGIELAANFRTPYFSRSLTEFWNRWHITLSQWLRDYIYFPTSRALLRRNPSRMNIPNILIPPMLTMLISGLWHGVGWGFIIWGGLHGFYLIVERVWSLLRPALPLQRQPKWRQAISMVLVFGAVLLAWIPFRMGGRITLDFVRAMTNLSDWAHPTVRLALLLVPALWLDWVQTRRDDELIFLRWPQLAQATLLALAILAILVATTVDTSPPFVYQGF
ncbi:MAG: MBOAT family protein [Chloroflexi bacterium]|nr:MBOAT family protein [Chloroflexota bacterium]